MISFSHIGFFILVAVVVAEGAVLFQNGTIIAFNVTTQSLQVLYDSSLLVENDRISQLFVGEAMPTNTPQDTEIVDATDKIISPGFVDTHHHGWQTAFKTIASNTSLPDYFQKYSEYSPAGHYFTPDDIYLGQLTGQLEMLNAGTTTVLDHAHGSFSNDTVDAALNATFEGGVRTFFAMAVHPLTNGYSNDDQIAKLRSLTYDTRLQNASGIVSLGLSFDRFYDAPSTEIDELWDIVRNNNLSIVTSHFLGGPWGDENTPTLLHSLGWLNTSTPIVFAHASFFGVADAQLLRDTNQYISTTPESELHFGHNHPYARLIQDQASVGIDCHFTYSTEMVQQARSWLQELRGRNYLDPLEKWTVPINNPMSVSQAFLLITRNGGLALRRDDLGVIREGAKADLVVFDGSSPNMLGWSDAIAAVVLHSNVGDIEHVMVNGQFVKRNRTLLYRDYPSLKMRFLDSAKKIQQIWRNIEWPALEGDFVQFVPQVEAVDIDVMRGNGTGY